jgi:hypothetical protein
MAGSFSDYAENKLLDMLFGGTPWAPLSLVYVGYFVGAAGETGPGAEPNAGNYQRIGIQNNTVMFPVTSTQIKTNAVEIDFQEATANHGTVLGAGVFDALQGGNMLAYCPLPTPTVIAAGDAMRIPVGSLSLQFQAGGGLSNYVKNGILNHVFGAVPFNPPTNLFFGYTSTAFSDAVAGQEPTVGGYGRKQVANTMLNFSQASSGAKTNAQPITFSEATALQGPMVAVGCWDSSSAGNFLAYYALASSQAIGEGVTPYIAQNSIQFKLD